MPRESRRRRRRTIAARTIRFSPAWQRNATDPLSRLLMQFLVIVAATRLTGRLFQKFGQPPVVGEMVAGILLGPSLFGWLFPDAFHFVFPSSRTTR